MSTETDLLIRAATDAAEAAHDASLLAGLLVPARAMVWAGVLPWRDLTPCETRVGGEWKLDATVTLHPHAGEVRVRRLALTVTLFAATDDDPASFDFSGRAYGSAITVRGAEAKRAEWFVVPSRTAERLAEHLMPERVAALRVALSDATVWP